MPLDRFYRLPAEKRANILRAAVSEFADKGFDAASLNAILAAAGLSKGSYYYYFVDKEDLYAETIADALQDMVRALPPVPPSELTAETFWPAVERYFRDWSRLALTRPTQLQLFRGVTPARRQSPRFAPILGQLGALYSALLATGCALGCVRTDLPLELLIGLLGAADAVLDEAFYAAHPQPSAEALDTHAARVLDTFRRLLAPEPGYQKTQKNSQKNPRRKP